MPGQVNTTPKHSHLILCIMKIYVFSDLGKIMTGLQWEFQVGPSVGISAGDQVWVARYILEV
jgi:hypothetical protein